MDNVNSFEEAERVLLDLGYTLDWMGAWEIL